MTREEALKLVKRKFPSIKGELSESLAALIDVSCWNDQAIEEFLEQLDDEFATQRSEGITAGQNEF